jgi:hypothetical protein
VNLNEVAVSLYGELSGGRVISLADRDGLGLAAGSIEAALGAVVCSYPVLLHGTGDLIPAGTPLRLSPGRQRFGQAPHAREGFATDSAGVALLKALFANIVNLGYPYVITPQSPLKLTIEKWVPEAERLRGYVHIIGPKSHFERERHPSGRDTWQWVTSRDDAVFGGAVEVQPADFVYPVERRRG